MELSILIISYKSLLKLKKCISHIGPKREIIIVENSNKAKIKEEIEKKYKNCKVIINGSNFGYGRACNIGLKQVSNQYVLILNTDVIINYAKIKTIEREIIKLKNHFAAASPVSDDLINFLGNKFDSYLEIKKININKKKNFSKVDIVKGHSLIINLKKFKNKNIFDENFFFFFEEIDLCRRLKKASENIYILNKIKIYHEAGGSIDSKSKYKQIYNDFRNWNYLWSRFYYHKKHYGYLMSFIKHFSKLNKYFLKFIFFYFFSKIEYRNNKFRFMGLICSMIGIKSSISDKILEKISLE